MCLQLKWANINLSSLRARPDLYGWPLWAFVWQTPLLLLSSSLEINPLLDLLDSGWKCSAAAIHHSGAAAFDVGLLWPTGGLEMDFLTVPPWNSFINPAVWPWISPFAWPPLPSWPQRSNNKNPQRQTVWRWGRSSYPSLQFGSWKYINLHLNW